MFNIIVVFFNQKDATNIRSLLSRRGYTVVAAFTSGASVRQAIDQMEGSEGIIVSGYRYQDMTSEELFRWLPDTYRLVVLASGGYLERMSGENVVKIPMPVKAEELFMALEDLETDMMRERKKRRLKPKVRSSAEQELLDCAKGVLMAERSMSEAEAHRYIQKCSMDNGIGLVETAQMVLKLYGKAWKG